MNLFQRGYFTLHSGAKSHWKIDCNALSDDDWQGIAEIAMERLPKFQVAIGIPRGGLKFAKALNEPGRATFEFHHPFLIVDDVLTTGLSMKEEKERCERGGRGCIGVVLFARGICPTWITPLFQLYQER